MFADRIRRRWPSPHGDTCTPTLLRDLVITDRFYCGQLRERPAALGRSLRGTTWAGNCRRNSCDRHRRARAKTLPAPLPAALPAARDQGRRHRVGTADSSPGVRPFRHRRCWPRSMARARLTTTRRCHCPRLPTTLPASLPRSRCPAPCLPPMTYPIHYKPAMPHSPRHRRAHSQPCPTFKIKKQCVGIGIAMPGPGIAMLVPAVQSCRVAGGCAGWCRSGRRLSSTGRHSYRLSRKASSRGCLGTGQEGDHRGVGAFVRNGQHPLDQPGVFGAAQRGGAEQRVDRGQPQVAGRHRVAAAGFEVVERGPPAVLVVAASLHGAEHAGDPEQATANPRVDRSRTLGDPLSVTDHRAESGRSHRGYAPTLRARGRRPDTPGARPHGARTNDEIARRLFLSRYAVGDHVKAILEKVARTKQEFIASIPRWSESRTRASG